MAKDDKPTKVTVKNGLYKRGKTWYVRTQINGRLIRKAIGPNRSEAEAVLKAMHAERARAHLVNDWQGFEELTKGKCLLTFKEVAEEYLHERANNKESSKRTYLEYLNGYLFPKFSNVLIADITEADIAQFQSGLGLRLSASRANNAVNLLRSILKSCVRRGLIKQNPSEGVRRLEEPAVDIDPLTRDELELALSCVLPHYRPIFTALAWTGARPCELKGLRWQHVLLPKDAGGTIEIKQARVRGVEGLPKTKTAQRVIPVLPPVRQALESLRCEHPVQNIEGYVFTDKHGLPLNRGLDQIWAKALKKAGLRHRPSYQLRHTFASLCIESGASPGWVSKVLGHSTLQTTFRHYARYIDDAEKTNERLMQNLFSTQEKPKMTSFN